MSNKKFSVTDELKKAASKAGEQLADECKDVAKKRSRELAGEAAGILVEGLFDFIRDQLSA